MSGTSFLAKVDVFQNRRLAKSKAVSLVPPPFSPAALFASFKKKKPVSGWLSGGFLTPEGGGGGSLHRRRSRVSVLGCHDRPEQSRLLLPRPCFQLDVLLRGESRIEGLPPFSQRESAPLLRPPPPYPRRKRKRETFVAAADSPRERQGEGRTEGKRYRCLSPEIFSTEKGPLCAYRVLRKRWWWGERTVVTMAVNRNTNTPLS